MSEVIFDKKNWSTPNTYDSNFRDFPSSPGVYVILNYDLGSHTSEILYIGSAKNLSIRHKSHEVRRWLSEFYEYLPVYFMETENYIDVERNLIRKYRPKYNKQHNG